MDFDSHVGFSVFQFSKGFAIFQFSVFQFFSFKAGDHFRQFLKYCIHHVPTIQSCDVGVESAPRFCVVLFSFSSFGITKVEVDPRVQRTHFFTALGVVWRQIRGAAIGSQISPTLSNLAVTLIERSWSSTYQEPNQIFIILQSGTSTTVLSLYRSTIFRLQCSKCLQTWTFMVVQSNWSWLPTIYFSAFMLMFLKEQSFTSYQTFAKFGTMFQPEPSDCV